MNLNYARILHLVLNAFFYFYCSALTSPSHCLSLPRVKNDCCFFLAMLPWAGGCWIPAHHGSTQIQGLQKQQLEENSRGLWSQRLLPAGLLAATRPAAAALPSRLLETSKDRDATSSGLCHLPHQEAFSSIWAEVPKSQFVTPAFCFISDVTKKSLSPSVS